MKIAKSFGNYPKHMFDIDNKEHLKLFKKYLHTNAWGPNGCPFVLEWPYLDIPNMLKDKITNNALKGLK